MSNLTINLAFRWSAATIGSRFSVPSEYRPLQMALYDSPSPNNPEFFGKPPVNSFLFQITALESQSYETLSLSVAGGGVQEETTAQIWSGYPDPNWVQIGNSADQGYLYFSTDSSNSTKIFAGGTPDVAFYNTQGDWHVGGATNGWAVLGMKTGVWEVSFMLKVTLQSGETRTFIGDPEMSTGSQGGH